MKENSTPVSEKTYSTSTDQLHARPSTLSVIMQFARTYTYVPKLQNGLQSCVAN